MELGFYKFAVSQIGESGSRDRDIHLSGIRAYRGSQKLTVTQLNFEKSVVHQNYEFYSCVKNISNHQLVTLHLRIKVTTLFSNYYKLWGTKRRPRGYF